MSIEQIDQFFKFADSFFSEYIHIKNIPMGNSWSSEFNGNVPNYSKFILKGIFETLCILAVYGNEFFGKRLQIDFQDKVNQIVLNVFQELDSEKWLNIRENLEYFAEASPDVFLDSILVDLSTKSPQIQVLLGSTSGSTTGVSLQTELLWALEKLAWHREYFERVVDILFELQNFQSNDSQINKIQDTLNDLFRTWLPSTELP